MQPKVYRFSPLPVHSRKANKPRSLRQLLVFCLVCTFTFCFIFLLSSNRTHKKPKPVILQPVGNSPDIGSGGGSGGDGLFPPTSPTPLQPSSGEASSGLDDLMIPPLSPPPPTFPQADDPPDQSSGEGSGGDGLSAPPAAFNSSEVESGSGSGSDLTGDFGSS